MEDEVLRQTAIHEAGHAVAHVRLRLDHDGAHIIPDGESLLGAAAGEGQRHVWDKDQAGPVVLACCAGYAACLAAGYADDKARAGTEADFVEAGEVIEHWGLDGGIEAWQSESAELMSRPENRAAVALVAEHLLQRKRLDGDYVEVLIGMADGITTEAEFAQYLQLRGIAS